MATIKTWIFILFLLLGGPIAVLATHETNGRVARILDHGRAARAEISKVEWSTKHGRDYDYKLLVTFSGASGQAVKAKVAVDDTTGKAAADDKLPTIDVKYLPEDPRVVYLADPSPPSSFGYYLGAAMFIAAIGMIFFRRRKTVTA